MARPRKIQPEPEMVYAATEREPAPVTYQPPTPRQMQVERQGAHTEPFSRRFPEVRGGICDYCGVLDRGVSSEFQYKLCPHYRGQNLRCSYCPDGKDPNEVVYHANLNIAEHPDRPGTLIVWCNSYNCSRAHEERFKVSA